MIHIFLKQKTLLETIFKIDQLLRTEQNEYLKVLHDEKTLNEQLTQDLKNKLAFSQAECQELQQKFDLKQVELEKLTALHTRTELKLQTISEQNSAFKQKNEDLAKHIVELQNNITELKATIHDNEKEYVLNNKKMALQTESEKMFQTQTMLEINKLKQEVQKLTEKDQENRQRILQLSKELQETTSDNEHLHREKAEMEERMNEMQEKIEKDEKKLTEFTRNEENLRKKEKSNEELIFKLSSELDQLKNTRATQDKKLENLKENYENELIRISEENNERIDGLESKFKSELERKEEEVLKAQSELYTYKVNLERINKENNNLGQTLKELTVAKTDSAKALIEKTRIIKELRGRLNALDDDLNRRVMSMTYEKNSLESTLESIKDQMDNTSDKVKSLNSTINGLNSEKGMLKGHIENLMRDKQDLVAKLEGIRRRLQEKYEDLLDENLFNNREII